VGCSPPPYLLATLVSAPRGPPESLPECRAQRTRKHAYVAGGAVVREPALACFEDLTPTSGDPDAALLAHACGPEPRHHELGWHLSLWLRAKYRMRLESERPNAPDLGQEVGRLRGQPLRRSGRTLDEPRRRSLGGPDRAEIPSPPPRTMAIRSAFTVSQEGLLPRRRDLSMGSAVLRCDTLQRVAPRPPEHPCPQWSWHQRTSARAAGLLRGFGSRWNARLLAKTIGASLRWAVEARSRLLESGQAA
jgi:hypothetical protein